MQVVVEKKVGRKIVRCKSINTATFKGFVPPAKPIVRQEDLRIEGQQLLHVSQTVPQKPRRVVYDTRPPHWL